MKTQFDIYTSAHAAAVKALTAPNNFAVENTALEAFNADGNDPLDWDYWKQTFDNRRANMLALKMQPATSTKAATAAKVVPASRPPRPSPQPLSHSPLTESTI